MRNYLLTLALVLTIGISTTNAQTYCYKYLYNVTNDDVRKKGIASGSIFYFTFNNNKSMCYMTDKNGVYSLSYGIGTYKYIGKRNGMFIFKEQSTNMFHQEQNMLYFSEDFMRLNWKCNIDKYGSNGNPGLRVLKYIEDPDYDEIPNELY